MKFIFPAEIKELDTKVTNIVRWYDSSMRLWIVYAANAEGDQIGDADYPYGRDYSMEVAVNMATSHGLTRKDIHKGM